MRRRVYLTRYDQVRREISELNQEMERIREPYKVDERSLSTDGREELEELIRTPQGIADQNELRRLSQRLSELHQERDGLEAIHDFISPDLNPDFEVHWRDAFGDVPGGIVRLQDFTLQRDRLYRVDQVFRLYGFNTPDQMYRAIKRAEFPAVRIGREYRIHPESAHIWLKERAFINVFFPHEEPKKARPRKRT